MPVTPKASVAGERKGTPESVPSHGIKASGRAFLRTWSTRLGLTALVAVLVPACAWHNYLLRHKMLRLVSVAERSLSDNGAASGLGDQADRSIPLYVHAAKTSARAIPCSVAAVEACASSFRRVEVDVAFSSDLVPYLSHGDNLSRISNSKQAFTERLSSKALDKLALSDGSRLMRLAAFCKLHARRFEHVILDVKTSHSQARQKAETVSRILGDEDGERYAVVSLSGPFLTWLRRKRPQMPVGCESYLAVSNWLAGFQVASWTFTEVTEDIDERARKLGLKRLYWTAWTDADLALIAGWHPEYIVVDLSGTAPPAIPAQWRREAAGE